MPEALPMLDLPVDDTSIADAAVMYYRAGFTPIRAHAVRNDGGCTCREPGCRTPGKHPVVRQWERTQYDSADQVRDEFRTHTGNIGIAVRQRFVVVDVDGSTGQETLARVLAEAGREMPPTLTALSGSGVGTHYVFTAPNVEPGTIRDNKPFGQASRVDIKHSGFIVVAPSVHKDGGRYRWTNPTPPIDLPDWLYQLIRVRKRTAAPETPAPVTTDDLTMRRVRAYLERMPRSIQGQGGSAAILHVAARLIHGEIVQGDRRFRLPESDAWSLLQEWNTTHADPPWDVDGSQGLRRKFEEARDKWTSPLEPMIDRQPLRVFDGGASPAVAHAPANDESWKRDLEWKTVRGQTVLRKVAVNARIILEHDHRWTGRIRYDSFARRIVATSPPWDRGVIPAEVLRSDRWTDTDTARLRDWLVTHYGLELSTTDIDKAIEIVAEAQAYSSSRDWLSSLTWDGTRRLDSWLVRYLGSDDNEYTRAVGRWWLVSAVARALQPGCQADYTLILEGPQGIGKSTALRTLAGSDWFSDTPIDLDHKDSYQALDGRLIYEFSELESLLRKSPEKCKAFLSSRVDHYRPQYGRRQIAAARQCVFAGTTNQAENYFRDETGNRRFWPVWCRFVDRAALAEDRAQIWAEAVDAYQNGANWHPETDAEAAMCAGEQFKRAATDEWDEVIRRWITEPLSGEREKFTLSDVLSDGLGMPRAQWGTREQRRASDSLRRLGYVSRRSRVNRYWEKLQ